MSEYKIEYNGLLKPIIEDEKCIITVTAEQVEELPTVVVSKSRGVGGTHVQRLQVERARLERGEIDLLTYLDIISKDDI